MGEVVYVSCNGMFGATRYIARTKRECRTDKSVNMPASTMPTFRAGKSLNDIERGRAVVGMGRSAGQSGKGEVAYSIQPIAV